MPEENLFSSVGKAVFSKFVKSKAEEKAHEIFYEKFGDKKLRRKTEEWLKTKYGNEPFFNNLEAYLKQNYTISRVIRIAHGEYDFEENNPTAFKTKHYANFVREYPKYADAALKESIQKVLSELYEYIHFAINKISPYSESGKILRNYEKNSNNNAEKIINNQDKNTRDIMCAIRELKDTSENGTHCFATDLLGISEKVDHYLKEILDIENNYQKNRLFPEAIQKYHEILSEIVCLPNTSVEFKKLLSALYCNLSLCYSNTGNYESAQKYIKQIPYDVCDDNPKYHFISAAIIINAEDTINYLDAVIHAECAVQLNPEYHKAFNLAMYIRIILQPSLLSKILDEYDGHFRELVSNEITPEILFEYYSNRGLIQLIGNDGNGALADFEKAYEYGNDDVLQYNTAAALYSVATKDIPKNTRIMFQELPQKQLLRAYTILKQLIGIDKSQNSLHRHITSLYISVCFLLGRSHELLLDEYISEIENMDPETVRIFLLGCEHIPQEISDKYLSDADRYYLIAGEYFNSGAFAECRSYIEGHLAEGYHIESPLYLTLMQACIAIPDISSYWKYRAHAHEYQLTGLYITSLDASAHELEGEINQAKTIMDELILKTVDYSILMNAVRFYGRNGYLEEQRTLYRTMYDKWLSLDLCINDISEFLMSYIVFLTANNDTTAVSILDSLPTDTLPEKIHNELYVNYYLQINSPQQLLPHAERLFRSTRDIQSGKLYAQTLKRLFNYNEAINICESLLELNPIDSEKNEIYWMLSDIWFLNGDKDRSYEWAVRARDIVHHIPEDPSHQVFMARAFLCEHLEGIATTLEYKHRHPVVVDYLHEFHFDTESPTAGEEIISTLNSLMGIPEERNDQEAQIIYNYKNIKIPTYLIIKYFSDDWLSIMVFAQKNKLNVDMGDRELLHHDIASIHDKIVVDAQTLIIMMLFDCIEALSYIDTVYINTGSIDYLQHICFSSHNTCAVKVLQYICKSDNVHIIADGFIQKNSSEDIFGTNFNVCCALSCNLDIPFLYHDVLAKILQTNNVLINPEVRFISIRAICGYVQTKGEDMAEQWYYNLLHGCTFISCGAKTIIYQIKANSYDVTDELLQPFMFCKSDYDMESFASVYCTAIRELIPEHLESAEKLADIVIRDAIRVLRRGQYHRMYSEMYPEHKEKAERINKYAMTIGISISTMLPHPSLLSLSENISVLADTLAG